MVTRNFFLFSFILVLFVSCAEKTGYYEPNEQKIIDNLTKNKSWERDYHAELDNGEKFDVHERWIFKDNGTGSCQNTTLYENGESKEMTTYFHWAFSTPNFSVIYMDYELYWEIEELTAYKLRIYETYRDPILVTGQTYRDYQEFKVAPID